MKRDEPPKRNPVETKKKIRPYGVWRRHVPTGNRCKRFKGTRLKKLLGKKEEAHESLHKCEGYRTKMKISVVKNVASLEQPYGTKKGMKENGHRY